MWVDSELPAFFFENSTAAFLKIYVVFIKVQEVQLEYEKVQLFEKNDCNFSYIFYKKDCILVTNASG